LHRKREKMDPKSADKAAGSGEWKKPTSGASGSGKEGLTKTTFRLPTSLLKEVKHYAVDREMSDQDVFNAALRAYMTAMKEGEKEK
jgi:hypothetical protein